jgi:hypothetical protein
VTDEECFRPLRYDGCIRLNKYISESNGTPVTALEFVDCNVADKREEQNLPAQGFIGKTSPNTACT